ncbi:double zinc ribbon and ankyrin repeat-containing protein 1 isoform X1 [Phyllopteryx taeniolatus]|uniref:double zinc ribbon and ankyrin repeat-containing protein 1 isoform X1 n=2 Tax=Phyllopteryx taeniolatus TaxID=161469 RepID=UPI002AD1EF1A|nr:double zinc ribbon and ankyrin repeat-containing protein 1 isoform X1 [Phyllopteryx taeniolatus]
MTAGAVAPPRIIPIKLPASKNHVDTSTRVCIQSDTGDALLFYTLDGSKPAARPPSGRGGPGGGRRYVSPFLLPSGRVCVRAVAVTSDGRQSAAVAKVFFVTEADPLQQQVSQEEGLHDNVMTSPQGSKVTGSARSESGPRRAPPASGSTRSHSENAAAPRHRSAACEADARFRRCVQCSSLRRRDDSMSLCIVCGVSVPPLPRRGTPPIDGGQLVCCVMCDAEIPVNTHVCSTCRAPVWQKLRPRLEGDVLCACCGRGNPTDLSNCLTCETCLHTTALEGNSAPFVRVSPNRKLSCSKCGRLNRIDARHCDWCGTKCEQAVTCVSCVICGAGGSPQAVVCAVCGHFLDAAPTSCRDATTPTYQASPPTAEQYTQTSRPHFVSAAKFRQQEQQKSLREDRRPPHTAISPGRGYWRTQLDHVCAHLRSFAQNNAPFRTLLGEPRLGRMVSGVLQEGAREVTLTLGFKDVGKEAKQEVRQEVASEAVDKMAATTKTCRGSGSNTSVMVRDVQLLQELGPGPTRGRVGVVQQLLDQGADPGCCDSDGRSATVMAAVNGHHAVLPLLLQRGADVDRPSGQMKNTALHEAAALGPQGLRCAHVLISCNAATGLRNKDGRTAYDVAAASGCAAMMSLLNGSASLEGVGLPPD